MTSNANEPAYPTPAGHAMLTNPYRTVEVCTTGLTKREYFAAMAMQGMLAANWPIEVDDYGPRELSSDARKYADALLAALAAGKESEATND